MILTAWQRAGLNGGLRAKEHCAKTGWTYGGHRVWTPEEDQVVRDRFPDYVAMQEQLPHRTRKALEDRTRLLDLVTRRHTWTNQETARLRSMYWRGCTIKEVLEAFPGKSAGQLASKAKKLGIRRPRRQFKTLGVPVLDAVRQQAYAAGLTLKDLDALARTKRYYQGCKRRVVWKRVAAGVELLDGELRVHWKD